MQSKQFFVSRRGFMPSTPTRRKGPGEKVWGFRTSKLKKVSLKALKNFDEWPIIALLVVILLQISSESDLSQGKPDVVTGAGAPSSSESILTPEAASCFHLSSRQRLCCHRCVNISLLHSRGYSFMHAAAIIASHLCSGAPAAARRHECHLEIDLRQTSILFCWKWERLEGMRVCAFHAGRAQNSMTSHLPAINMFILSKFGRLFICSESFPAAQNPTALAEWRQGHYTVWKTNFFLSSTPTHTIPFPGRQRSVLKEFCPGNKIWRWMSLRVNHLRALLSQCTDRHDKFPSRASAFGCSAPVLQPRPPLDGLHVGSCCSRSEDAQVLSLNGWASSQGFSSLFSVISCTHGFLFFLPIKKTKNKTLHLWFTTSQNLRYQWIFSTLCVQERNLNLAELDTPQQLAPAPPRRQHKTVRAGISQWLAMSANWVWFG